MAKSKKMIKTIQEEIEKALFRITRQKINSYRIRTHRRGAHGSGAVVGPFLGAGTL